MAAEHDNAIDFDPSWIKEEIHAKVRIDFELLIREEWLEVVDIPDVTIPYNSVQNRTNLYLETETETETEKEKDPLTPQGESREGLREFLEKAPEENPIGPRTSIPNRQTPKPSTQPNSFSDDTWKILNELQKMGAIWLNAQRVNHSKSGRTVGQIIDEAVRMYGYEWACGQIWDEREGYFHSKGLTGIKTPAGLGGMILYQIQNKNLEKINTGSITSASERRAKETADRILANIKLEDERKQGNAGNRLG
jgi:hypothetical protein